MLKRILSNGHRSSRSAWLVLAGTALLTAGGVTVYRRPFETLRTALRLGLRLSGVRGRTVEADGLLVHYLEAGSTGRGSRGPTLVLMHGLGGSALDWGLVIPALARGHRVLALDLPGFGDTPAPQEGMKLSALAQYLGGFLDTLGVERAAIAGNSLGGAVAIRYSTRNPDRVEHLFLLNSAGLLYDPPPELEPGDRDQARELIRMVNGAPSNPPGFVLDGMVRRAEDPARRAYLRSDEPTDVKEDLPNLTAPTTIIWGDRDGLIPPDHGEAMHAEIPGSELIMLKGVGHVPQLQVPRETVRLLTERLG